MNYAFHNSNPSNQESPVASRNPQTSLSVFPPSCLEGQQQRAERIEFVTSNNSSNELVFQQFDLRRLTINKDFYKYLTAHKLLNCDTLLKPLAQEDVIKGKLSHRTTSRFSLQLDDDESRAFFIKRHTPVSTIEYLKNWLRLRPVYLGAMHEWEAILTFRKHGISTLTPVAVGTKGRCSFLITEALYNMISVKEWLTTQPTEGELYSAVKAMARLTRLMHGSGLHHQDYYFDHLYIPLNSDTEKIHLIDLGRADQKNPLTEYWVVKDLAQWNYSARHLAPEFRNLFFEFYFGSIAQPVLNRLMRRIQKKTAAIARHSARHSLG